MGKILLGITSIALLWSWTIATTQGRTEGSFDIFPGKLEYVSGSERYLWGVDPSDYIYRCNRPCDGNWIQVPGLLKQLDIDENEVWGVNFADRIWKRPVDGSGHWQLVPGLLKHVSASGNGYIWGVNSGDRIFKCKKPCNGAWILVDGLLKQIDGGQHFVYGVNSQNQIWSRPVDGSGYWRLIPGLTAVDVTASKNDDIFAITPNKDVYRCRKPCRGGWEKMGGSMEQCSAACFVSIVNSKNMNSIEKKV